MLRMEKEMQQKREEFLREQEEMRRLNEDLQQQKIELERKEAERYAFPYLRLIWSTPYTQWFIIDIKICYFLRNLQIQQMMEGFKKQQDEIEALKKQNLQRKDTQFNVPAAPSKPVRKAPSISIGPSEGADSDLSQPSMRSTSR